MPAASPIADRALDDLAALVEVSSWSHDLDGLAACAPAVAELFGRLGAAVRLVDLPPAPHVRDDGTVGTTPVGQAVVAGLRPGADRRILLVGHYDTVFPPDSGFVLDREADVWRGPGVVDAKGGLVVAAAALEAAEAEGIDVGWDVVVVPDEEIGSPGSAGLLAEMAGRADIGFGYEPSMPDGSVAGARPGSANFVHVVRGKAAHAGRELDEGRNAILAAARLAQEIDALNHHPDVLANPGRIHGGSAVNVVPDLAVLRSNVRPRTDAAAAYVTEALAEAIDAIAVDGIDITQHGGITRPPKELNDRYRTLLDAVSAAGHALGMDVAWRDTGGVCDGNNLAGAGLVNVDNLGPIGGDLHRPTEYLEVASIAARAKLGTALIVGFDRGRL